MKIIVALITILFMLNQPILSTKKFEDEEKSSPLSFECLLLGKCKK